MTIAETFYISFVLDYATLKWKYLQAEYLLQDGGTTSQDEALLNWILSEGNQVLHCEEEARQQDKHVTTPTTASLCYDTLSSGNTPMELHHQLR